MGTLEAQLSPEELEVRLAQERLGEARKKLGEAKAAELKKAQEAQLQRKLAEQAVLVEAERKRKEVEDRWADKRREEAEAQERARQAQKAEDLRLEAEVSRLEEAARQSAKQQAEVSRLEQEAFQAEREAERIAAELVRPTSISTVESPANGRNLLFERLTGVEAPAAVEAQATPVDEKTREVPEEYLVIKGHLSTRVMAERFTEKHPGTFFLSPNSGDLVLNGYHFRLLDSVSPRSWNGATRVYITSEADGYFLNRVGSADRVGVVPVQLDELAATALCQESQ